MMLSEGANKQWLAMRYERRNDKVTTLVLDFIRIRTAAFTSSYEPPSFQTQTHTLARVWVQGFALIGPLGIRLARTILVHRVRAQYWQTGQRGSSLNASDSMIQVMEQ